MFERPEAESNLYAVVEDRIRRSSLLNLLGLTSSVKQGRASNGRPRVISCLHRAHSAARTAVRGISER